MDNSITEEKTNNKVYVSISLPKGEKDVWIARAEQDGRSLSSFIRKKVNGD